MSTASSASPTSTMPVLARMVEASKWYGEVIGLNQVSLEIRPGITGLLGPNGAGKSTFLKLLTGQLKVSRGHVEVLGRDPWSDPSVYRSLGYCPDTEQLYEEMTGREFVHLMGRLAGYSARESRRRAAHQLERVSMTAHCDRLIRGYSKGMRQRTRLAAALMHDPTIIVLDEPLNGLDPMGRIELINIFRELAADGKSVVVSSHILHEIQNLTRHMVMLHRGRVLAEGEITEVRALIDSQPLTLRITAAEPRAVGRLLMQANSLNSLEFHQSAEGKSPDSLTVRTTTPDEIFQLLQDSVIADNLQVTGIEALDESLDAVFHYLVDKQ